MNDRLKGILSVLTLGVFAMFAIASLDSLDAFELDESTNVSVNLRPEDCEEKPPFTGTLKVNVALHRQDGSAIFGAGGKMLVSEQKIIDPQDCVSSYTRTLDQEGISLSTGSYHYESPEYTHTNKGDLWRVEVIINHNPALKVPPMREVRVVYYNTSVINFNFVIPSPL